MFCGCVRWLRLGWPARGPWVRLRETERVVVRTVLPLAMLCTTCSAPSALVKRKNFSKQTRIVSSVTVEPELRQSANLLGYVHPFLASAHDGMMFSTPYQQSDTAPTYNCAGSLGGGFWFNKCGLISPTAESPVWFSIGDSTWHAMDVCRIMVKPQ